MTRVAGVDQVERTLSGEGWHYAALPFLFVFFSVEMQRHWGENIGWLCLGCLGLVSVVWVGTVLGSDWADRFAADAADVAIFLFLGGCLALSQGFDGQAASMSAGKLLNWAPLVALWWALRHRVWPLRLIARLGGVLAGLLAVQAMAQPATSGLMIESFLLPCLVAALVWFACKGAMRTDAGQAGVAAGLTRRDKVTGLPGPERFEDELALTVAVADRYRIPFSLLICEISGLSEYAAEQGAAAANEVTKSFAWQLSDRLRIADTLCRWEEGKFIILLPNTDLESSHKLVERIRCVLDSVTLSDGGHALVRIGLAQHRYGDDPMATFSLAEASMYGPGDGKPHKGQD